jgi:hypothetical protein
MRSRGTCKHIQHPLMPSARPHCLATLAVILRGRENKRMPLCTLMTSCITNRHLPVILAPEERERKNKTEKTKENRLGI